MRVTATATAEEVRVTVTAMTQVTTVTATGDTAIARKLAVVRSCRLFFSTYWRTPSALWESSFQLF
jgi:hypothetical protein